MTKRDKQIEKFSDWLKANGAQVLAPTSEWEVSRFMTGQGTSIIYTNRQGQWSFTNEAAVAWMAYRKQRPWSGAPKNKKQIKSSVIARTLRKRDGEFCFFCQWHVEAEEESVEHLVPRASGGPNHIANFFLAHRVCNAKAGHLSAPEKIRLHVEAEMARGAIRSPEQVSA